MWGSPLGPAPAATVRFYLASSARRQRCRSSTDIGVLMGAWLVAAGCTGKVDSQTPNCTDRPEGVRRPVQDRRDGPAELRRVRQRLRRRPVLSERSVPVQLRSARVQRNLRRRRRHPLRRLQHDVLFGPGLQPERLSNELRRRRDAVLGRRLRRDDRRQRASLRRLQPLPGGRRVQRRRLRLLDRGPDAVRQRVCRYEDQRRQLRRLQPGVQRNLHERRLRDDDGDGRRGGGWHRHRRHGRHDDGRARRWRGSAPPVAAVGRAVGRGGQGPARPDDRARAVEPRRRSARTRSSATPRWASTRTSSSRSTSRLKTTCCPRSRSSITTLAPCTGTTAAAQRTCAHDVRADAWARRRSAARSTRPRSPT